MAGVSVWFTILGSGSGGNCAYIEAGETRLLIDAGFSARQIRERLSALGRTPETLTGILVTHEHIDHVQGLAVLCGKSGIPVYGNRFTCEALTKRFPGKLRYSVFETGSVIRFADLEVQSFPVPHDAADPVNFLIRTGAGTVGFLTDLGHVTQLVRQRASEAEILVLEANHDVRLLQEDTKRPWSTKQRILSRHGHLSNDAAGTAAAELLEGSGRLRHVYLGHMSRDCNRPELAMKAVRDCLNAVGGAHVVIEGTSQSCANPTLELRPIAVAVP